jgi:hypothetical protein
MAMKQLLPIYATPVRDPLSMYASANRAELIVVAGLLIAPSRWLTGLPSPTFLWDSFTCSIMILGGFLSRTQLEGLRWFVPFCRKHSAICRKMML